MAEAGKECCDKVAQAISWMVAAFIAAFWVGLVAGLAALRPDLLWALPLVLIFLALAFIGVFDYCASRFEKWLRE
jgi:hypothetical protein